MADTYPNYAALAAAEPEGTAYTRTAAVPAGARWAAVAIHGGSIEGGSSEVARALANSGATMAFYEFAGTKASGNTTLHLTSTVFDEPQGRALVGSVRRCLSFHGYTGTPGVAETAVGGLDTVLADRLTRTLSAAGFRVTAAGGEIGGTDPANFCNRTSTGAGVQLEMSSALRASFFPGGNTRASRDSGARSDTFRRYVAALRAALLGRGLVAMGSVNVARYCLLPAPGADVDLTATVSTDALAVGGSHFLALVARYADGANMYLARLEFSPTQDVLLTLRRRQAGTETLLQQASTGLTHTAGRRIALRFQVTGSMLRARAWPDGALEPGTWQLEAADTSLTAAGQIGMRSILSTSNTNVLPVTAAWADFSTLGPTQTAVVTRAVNSVARALPAGEDVRLWQPAILAF